MTKYIKTISIIFLLFFSLPPLLHAEDPSKDLFYTQGQEALNAPPMHGVQENVDPFSGNLSLAHTDVYLPGNGGLDLKIMRVYNSAIWGRRDITGPGLVAANERSPLGIGWSMHMGIVKNPSGGAGSFNPFLTNDPVVEMSDGSQHVLYSVPGQLNTYKSKEHWIYKLVSGYTSKWELTLTDGTVYTFENNLAGPGYTTSDGIAVAQVTSIRNAAGTADITMTYTRPASSTYSYLTSIQDSAGRTINFNYDYSGHTLTSIIYGSKTFIDYDYQTIGGYKFLTQANLPEGNPWKYNYNTSHYELQAITFPAGGTITYEYSDVPFDTGVVNVEFSVVTGRTTGGRDISAGTWIYSYSTGGSSGNLTTISAPDGITEKHTFYGWGNCPSQGSCGNISFIGLPISKEVKSGATTILNESYAWVKSAQTISTDSIANSGWNGAGGTIYENGIYVPLLSSKSITRDGNTYTTSYSDYDQFGNAETISETGDSTRTTSIDYHWYNTAKNIVQNKPHTATVSGGFAGSFATTYTHDTDSGNITQINQRGVTTGFTYDASGNLDYVTDANNNRTYYDWTYGRISEKQNPIYTVTRYINSDGTIKYEKNGMGDTTNYTYDGNLRLTNIDPPEGNSTTFTYQTDNSSKKTSRGGYYTYMYFDGFGRPSGTSDSKGITTDITYWSYGPKESSASNTGDTINYDFFERVDNFVHKDSSTVNYTYSESNVTITDEAGNNTTYTYTAFGNPDEKLLMKVTDALSNVTSYDYNILGSLTKITQGGATRTFSYNSKDFLISESHPDRGSITYTRDNVGNMLTKTDGLGTTTHTYDDLNRLTRIETTSETVTMGYDKADNRIQLDNGSALIDYTYDKVNRLTRKSETIGGRAYNTYYAYDADDNLTDMTYPSGRTVTYGYNENNQVTSATGFGGSITSVAYYTSGVNTGLPYHYAYSNGHTVTLTYNNRNLTTGITAGSSALKMGYGYDSRGNTTTITNYLDRSQDMDLGYDDLNRLITFIGSWGNGSYSYNSLGNRLSKAVGSNATSYIYSNNRLASATSGGITTTYKYNNDDGYLTNIDDNVREFVYDRFHNLRQYVQDGTTTLAEFNYDGDGMRLTKTSDGMTTVYHYDQGGRVISENDGNNNPIADYVYLHGKLAAKVSPPPPAAPTNLEAWSAYANQINLSWTDNATDELGYIIERKAGSGSYVVIATLQQPNATSYADMNLVAGSTYSYRVKAYNHVGGSTYSIDASAVPVSNPVPDMSLLPSSKDFGGTMVNGSSQPQTFTISNIGTNDLMLGTVFITGADAGEFGISADGCTAQTLAPRGICTFTASFTPTSIGAKSANISIASNDPDMPTADVPLGGTGTVPNIAISSTYYRFGSIAVNSSSAPQTVTISNTGDADLVVGTITFAGANPRDFSKTADACSGRTIAPSGSCTVQVAFSPVSFGMKIGTFRIPCNDLDKPAVYALLSGAGLGSIGLKVPQISSSHEHNAAIRADGMLWAWGLNGYSSLLGDGTTNDRHAPVQIGADTKWVAVAAGEKHTLALKSDGTLWGWGSDCRGALGLGTPIDACTDSMIKRSPVQIGSDTNWVAIAAGDLHSLALKSDGTLWGWGSNSDGALGLGDWHIERATIPVQIGYDSDWIAVSGGSNHTLALKADGTLWACGRNTDGQVGDGSTTSYMYSPVQTGTGWAAISAGDVHSVALKWDGTLWAWGGNYFGAVGDGTSGPYANKYSPVKIGNESDWVSVSGGGGFTMAIKSSGTLWTWGNNWSGQLGHATTITPGQTGTDNDWISISAGYRHAVAIKSDGSLWAWGSNTYGEVGDGTTTQRNTPVRVLLGRRSTIAGGYFHSVALKSDGTLWAWGDNTYGQLGDGTTIWKRTPVQIGSDNRWMGVAAGHYFTVALKLDGTIWSWGDNTYGQLGDGTTTAKNMPAQIGADTDWVSISTGYYHTTAIKADGSLWAWGRNDNGQLGDGTTIQKNSPVRVGAGTNWFLVAAGAVHTIALKTDGSLWTWGANSYGQLGDSTPVTSRRTSPGQIGTDETWISITAGTHDSLAVNSDGTLWAWGYNEYGQLGDGTTTQRYYPVRIGTDNTWISISAGAYHNVALKSDGSLWSWGYNNRGQLGDGTATNSSFPLQLVSDNTWAFIDGGVVHSIAVKSDGTLWSWGGNQGGQLGDNTTIDKSTPLQVGSDTNWR